jgi:hypothetical protein
MSGWPETDGRAGPAGGGTYPTVHAGSAIRRTASRRRIDIVPAS